MLFILKLYTEPEPVHDVKIGKPLTLIALKVQSSDSRNNMHFFVSEAIVFPPFSLIIAFTGQ